MAKLSQSKINTVLENLIPSQQPPMSEIDWRPKFQNQFTAEVIIGGYRKVKATVSNGWDSVTENIHFKKDFDEGGEKYKYQLDVGGYGVKVIDDSAKQDALLKAKVAEYGRVMPELLTWAGTGGFGKGLNVTRKVVSGIEKIADGTFEAESLAQKLDVKKIVDNVKYLEYKPSSGIKLKTAQGETTTILGSYNKDMQHIIGEIGNVKSTDFGPRIGDFNVLNVPDELYVNSKQFWNEYNQPWLQNAIKRNDDILMATKPEFGSGNLLFRQSYETGKYELSGFGKEYYYLRNNGYIFDFNTMQMIPK